MCKPFLLVGVLFAVWTDQFSIFNTGGSQDSGVNALKHVELVYRSEVSCVNNLLTIMVQGSSRCYQSTVAVSGRDLHLAATAIYNHVLLRQTGQSESGARYVSFHFFFTRKFKASCLNTKTLLKLALNIMY